MREVVSTWGDTVDSRLDHGESVIIRNITIQESMKFEV